MKKLFSLFHLTSALLLAALLSLLALPLSAAAKEPAVGDTAPDFTFTDFAGKKHSLSEFRGKPVLLDVWATWCGPCIKEIPTLRAVHEELKDKNFVVLSISIDGKLETAQAYVAKNNMPWTQGFCSGAWRAEIVKKFGIEGIPSVWLIGADGKIKAHNLRGEETKIAARLLLENNLKFATETDVRVTGTVLDEDGKPIAGAQVAIMPFRRGNIAKGIAQKRSPILRLTTDANGIWTIEKLFSGATQVYITAYSDVYAPDNEQGLLESQELSDFYSGKSKITLLRGERIYGIVKDENGKTVAGVPVELRSGPLITPIRKTNLKGEFDFTIAKNAEEVGLGIEIKGYVPIARGIALGSHPWAIIELTLVPGKTRITGIVVDAQGKPLEDAKISVDDPGLPYQVFSADKAGRFSINNLPDKDITVSISRKGYGEERNFKLQPRKENKIVLKGIRKVSAKVIDSETGEAINNYTVDRASFKKNEPLRNIFWGSNQKNWIGYSEIKRDGKGGFQNELNHTNREYQFRVSAEGYYPSISQRISGDEKQIELLFRLEKGKATPLKVVDSQGKAVPDATITVSRFEKVESSDPDVMEQSGYPTSWMAYSDILYENGKLSKTHIPLFDELRTNTDGVFVLPPYKEKYRLVITHPSGWARIYSRELQEDKPIQLAPWGKIRGKILIGDKPGDVTKITCENRPTGTLTNRSNALSDKDGNFELNYLFPGIARVVQDKKRLKEVFVEAGKTTELDFTPEGRPVTGKLLLPESKEPRFTSIQMYQEKERKAQDSSPVRPDAKKWEEHITDEMLELEKNSDYSSRRNPVPWHQITFAKNDGTFRFEDIPAGKYHLSFHNAKARAQVEVLLPEGKTFTTEVQDLGTFDVREEIKEAEQKQEAERKKKREEIEEKKLKEVVVGDILPDFSFLDMEGKERHFSEYKGKTVLIYFWEARDQYTRGALPAVQSIAEQYKTSENFVVLRMSRDYDPDLTKGFIQEVGVPGLHGFLTKESFSKWSGYQDLFPVNRAWLISAEGKVLARDLLQRKMKKTVDTYLSGN